MPDANTAQGPPTLRQDIAAEAAHYHLSDQAKRLARIFALTFAAQLLSDHGHINGWAGLWSLLAGSAEAAYRQRSKTMAVKAAQRVAQDHEPIPPPWTPMP